MTPAKRLMDLILALLLSALLAVPFALFLIWLLAREGRPLFYVAERRGVILHALLDLRQDPRNIMRRLRSV